MEGIVKQAMAFAGSLGRYQGLIAYVKQNPEAYSHERLLEELFKLDSEERAKLDALETKMRDEDEQ